MKKLTPWFPATVKPVHVGMYETRRKTFNFVPRPLYLRLYWNGEYWSYPHYSRYSNALATMRGDDKWRGLAEKP